MPKRELPKELNDFNWGAFLLTFIWGIKHRAWITLLAIPLIWFQLPLALNWVLFAILQVYCGINGNKWAYQRDWWMKPKDFRLNQAKWGAFGLTVNIIVPIIFLSFLVAFIKKSPENPIQFAYNAQCKISYDKIKKGLKSIPIGTEVTESNFAQHFNNKFKNTKIENDTVIFMVNDTPLYDFKFTKSDETNCNSARQNCAVQSSFIAPIQELETHTCTFYIDSTNVIPDEKTKKSVQKGYNIFKYL
jgi:hypothetical protein